MIRQAGAAAALILLAGTPAALAGAGEPPEMRAARVAVAEMRQASVLPTPCEQAFGAFWRAFEAPGAAGLLRDGPEPDRGPVFGHGNLDARPMLVEAQRVCAGATGARGDLVVRVLKERAVAKRERLEALEATRRLIQGN